MPEATTVTAGDAGTVVTTTGTGTGNGQAQATPPDAAKNTETPAEQTVPYARFKEVNDALKVIQDERAKEKQAREAEDEAKLAKQAEWQQLAEKHKARIAELEPAHAALTERVAELEGIVIASLETEIKDWDADIKATRPKDADAKTLTAWVESHRSIAAKLNDKPAVPGNGRGPRMSGAAHVGQAAEAQRTNWENTARQRYRG